MEAFVEMQPPLASAATMTLLHRSSAAIVLAQDQELQVPGKLYELIGLGIPLVVVTETGSATDREARRLGSHTYAPDDTESIAAHLEQVWRDRHPEPRGPRGDIDYATLARELDEAVKGLMRR